MPDFIKLLLVFSLGTISLKFVSFEGESYDFCEEGLISSVLKEVKALSRQRKPAPSKLFDIDFFYLTCLSPRSNGLDDRMVSFFACEGCMFVEKSDLINFFLELKDDLGEADAAAIVEAVSHVIASEQSRIFSLSSLFDNHKFNEPEVWLSLAGGKYSILPNFDLDRNCSGFFLRNITNQPFDPYDALFFLINGIFEGPGVVNQQIFNALNFSVKKG